MPFHSAEFDCKVHVLFPVAIHPFFGAMHSIGACSEVISGWLSVCDVAAGVGVVFAVPVATAAFEGTGGGGHFSACLRVLLEEFPVLALCFSLDAA